MAVLFHFMPYILCAALAVLTLVVVFGGDTTRRNVHPRIPRQQYYRWDEISKRRD